jgi:hypothetical protein
VKMERGRYRRTDEVRRSRSSFTNDRGNNIHYRRIVSSLLISTDHTISIFEGELKENGRGEDDERGMIDRCWIG